MTDSLPQFYPSDLVPVDINEGALQEILRTLEAAIKRGIVLVTSESPVPAAVESAAYGTIFNGDLGAFFVSSWFFFKIA